MPMYEYKCPACGTTFEELVPSEAAGRKVACPKCGQRNVERQLSVFSAHAAPTKCAAGLPAAGCGHCCGSDGGCPMAE